MAKKAAKKTKKVKDEAPAVEVPKARAPRPGIAPYKARAPGAREQARRREGR